MSNACSNLTSDQDDDCYFDETYPCGNIVDCSFSIDATEYCDIQNAVSGQIYVLLITNYSGVNTDITATGTGTATTDCSIVSPCDILTLSVTPGACDANNNYTLTGTLSYENNPGTGTLTVTVNNGSNTYTQTFNPPFTDNQIYNISIPNIPGDGASTTVTATFSGETSCTQSATYTAPLCVTTTCDILTLNAAPSACDANYNYTVDGTLSYVNNPGTGTLTVTVNNGSNTYTQTFNPPFTDNQVFNFSIPDVPGNGANTTVTAVFSDDASCTQTVSFVAPICQCAILSGTYAMSNCDIDSSFIFSGHLTFAASPSSGTLTVAITTASGIYTQTFDAPFSDNVPLSFSIPGIPADNAPASAAAIFSDNTDCFYNFGNFTTPECHCEIDADFLPSPQVVILPSSTTQMVNMTDNGLSYYWTFGDGTTSTLESPGHTYPADSSGAYLVTLIATAPEGCKDTISRYVTIQDQLIFYVPNAFTPDGDEFNQLFVPVFNVGFDPYAFNMTIYNRFGEILFESKNASEGWDGSYHDKVVPDGVYTWTIKYKLQADDSHHEVNGHVTIIR